jgi:hypothetical protein
MLSASEKFNILKEIIAVELKSASSDPDEMDEKVIITIQEWTETQIIMNANFSDPLSVSAG